MAVGRGRRGNMLSNGQPTTAVARAKSGTLVSYRGLFGVAPAMNRRETRTGLVYCVRLFKLESLASILVLRFVS